MSSSRGKKAAVLASKKRKGESSSSSPIVKEGRVIFLESYRESSSPFLEVSHRARRRTIPNTLDPTLITGHCIDWAAVQQVQLAEAIRALLTTDP
ncbi:hypothetical protein GOBAR_AA36149 [Gossypium barbadense]|uniref:Uncharacterized protein n=1 Tax=Gossypium barbadense TaxID=3634 RepID=A0A2P5W0E5_GOSBA|nr:hypothetical protein GOBAR_AA36149 [Gossypium barbadense]